MIPLTLTPEMLLIVCPLVMLAGFVDSIAGGGGLISLPAYYLAGLPPALASGTNKLAAAMGTSLAAFHYGRSGRVDGTVARPAAAGAFLCSALGALLMRQLPQEVVRYLVLGSIPVAAIFTLRGGGEASKGLALSLSGIRLLALAIGCAIGFYDGLIGPGTGTFLILLFMRLFGSEAVRASGTAKVVNLSSNLAALGSLLITGDVMAPLGLVAGACAMLGAFLGSRLAIRRGNGLVRGMMLVVLFLLLAKLCLDMIR
ncbi:MAG: TSUP family transporter [Candidatus Limiplasma sp.]|nr:TSUP family transporter [Candidatus Limiplasma sp.]